MLQREDEHEMDREEKPDEILEMIKNGEDPNQEAFGPWYVAGIFFLHPLVYLLLLPSCFFFDYAHPVCVSWQRSLAL